MKRSFLNKIIILAVFTAALGCKTKKEIAATPVAGTETIPVKSSSSASAGILRKISDAEFNFNTLAIKAKAELNINNNSNSINLNIRMRKDEVIWISATAIAGLEVARVLITPDSIKIINRLQGNYTAKPFSYLYQFSNRKLDFRTLQALLTGNTLPNTLNENTSVEIMGDQMRLSGDADGINYVLSFNQDNQLTENHLKDPVSGRDLLATYSSFQNVSGKKIPVNIRLNSNAMNRPVAAELKYSAITADGAIEIPFTVPKRFLEN